MIAFSVLFLALLGRNIGLTGMQMWGYLASEICFQIAPSIRGQFPIKILILVTRPTFYEGYAGSRPSGVCGLCPEKGGLNS
jgi:hypothetical protein